MKIYAVKNKDDNIRLNSSSGGVFTALAEVILDIGGIVIGAAWDGLNVQHIAIDNKDDLGKLRGSKYVASTVDYSLIKTDKPLLFSGTPCQMPKLKDNQYAVDVICHGTPTKESFQKYCEDEGISEINFRDKSTGWASYSVTTNKEKAYAINNKFMNDFLNNRNLQQKCYNCQFKNFKSQSDIMIGDFWGVNIEYPDFYDNKGVSLLFIKTEKGQQLFDLIKDKIDYIEVEYEKALKYNPSIIESARR